MRSSEWVAANDCQREPSGPSIVTDGWYWDEAGGCDTDVTLQGRAVTEMHPECIEHRRFDGRLVRCGNVMAVAPSDPGN